jgi:ATP-dependent Zn protease
VAPATSFGDMSARIAIERARTAYHEAGHLVVGMLLGFRCSFVSIRPDETRGSLGRVVPLETHGDPTTVDLCRRSTEHWLCVLFAGYAAEVRFAPDAREAAREGARGDDEQAETLLERAGMANHSTRHLLRARAAELVEQHWSVIEGVARALLREEEFDADEAERIYGRAALREPPGSRVGMSRHRG